MSNIYGVAQFAKQNAVPQVEWKNIDIIGQYIDNLQKEKQLEMMDRNYELAKDQFNYDKERDLVEDRQWEKAFAFNASEADKNRQHAFNLEKMKYGHKLGEIAARENAFIRAENRAKKDNFNLFDTNRKELQRVYNNYLTKAKNYTLAGDSINAKKYSTKADKLLDQNYRIFGNIAEELPQEELISRLALFIANKVDPQESLILK